MKYVLFAATIILIALSSEAQAPTGIVVGGWTGQGALKPHSHLILQGRSILVNCTEDNAKDTTYCDLKLIESDIRMMAGAPNTQK